MNKKLEEIMTGFLKGKNKPPVSVGLGKLGYETGFEIGFSAAIQLDLAVKFGVFLGRKCEYRNNSYYSYQGISYTTEQLYNYWLDNVLKLE